MRLGVSEMNSIRFWMSDQDEDGALLTFAAVVVDGKACGPYMTELTYHVTWEIDVETFLPMFLADLQAQGKRLHLREHE
jgi:hypothetical protein